MTIEQIMKRMSKLTEFWASTGETRRYWQGRLWAKREFFRYQQRLIDMGQTNDTLSTPASAQTAADVQAARHESETRRADDMDNSPRRNAGETY